MPSESEFDQLESDREIPPPPVSRKRKPELSRLSGEHERNKRHMTESQEPRSPSPVATSSRQSVQGPRVPSFYGPNGSTPISTKPTASSQRPQQTARKSTTGRPPHITRFGPLNTPPKSPTHRSPKFTTQSAHILKSKAKASSPSFGQSISAPRPSLNPKPVPPLAALRKEINSTHRAGDRHSGLPRPRAAWHTTTNLPTLKSQFNGSASVKRQQRSGSIDLSSDDLPTPLQLLDAAESSLARKPATQSKPPVAPHSKLQPKKKIEGMMMLH